jgi:hypothetical protein
MQLFKRKTVEPEVVEPIEEEPPPPPPPPPGPHLLFDGPVLARWFLLYRLEQELERAKRYGSCLSLLLAEPQRIARERVREEQRLAAALAANRSSRTVDLVGWLDESRIAILLPEADGASARFAVTRLRDEMWVSSHVQGNQKWQISMIDDLTKIEEMLDQQVELQANELRAMAEVSATPDTEEAQAA